MDPLPLGTLVAVEWMDAHASMQAEQTLDEIAVEELSTYTSFGKLVRCDAHVVAVAADERDDGRYRGVTYIPAAMVTRITSKQRKKHVKQPTPAE